MISETSTPDAVFVPESLKRGRTQYDRIGSILAIVEPILGVDRSRGEKAWIRKQPGQMLFITKSPDDTIYFPTVGPMRGDRYVWVEGDDGIRRGYLRPEATDE